MNKLRSILLIIYAVIVLAAAMTSCHTARKATVTETMVNGPTDTWTSVYMPVKVSLNKPMNMSLGGRATMVRGQYIHFSMRFIGMEVAVLYIDRDSVYFVDKYHKYLFAEPLATVLGRDHADMTVTDLQRIFLGQIKPVDNSKVSVGATDFMPTPAGDVAKLITINTEVPRGVIVGSVDWSVEDATWDEPGRKATFKMPSGYKRITTASLLSMLKAMSF